MNRIRGRTALVTGAASGIGLAISTALLQEGARVVLADINETQLRRVAEPLGESAAAFVLDVTSRGQWADAKRFVEAQFGPVEILVCNAGVGPDLRDLADMDPASFDRNVQINLFGVFNGVSAFAAGMRDRGEGHIVTTSSMAGVNPLPTAGAYTAAKFGVVGLSEALRAELAPSGVGVSVLCPGLVLTPMMQAFADSAGDRSGGGAAAHNLIDPALVGPLVLAAIRENIGHIFTHGEYAAAISARNEELLAGIAHVPVRGPA